MTTIAYCGKYLATDSQVTDGNSKWFSNKLWKWDKGYFAVTGNFRDYLGYKDWLNGEPDVKISKSSVCIYSEGKSVFYVEPNGMMISIKAPFAEGSGGPAALAAMMMGADAKKAVQIASKIDTMTGGRVNSVKVKNG